MKLTPQRLLIYFFLFIGVIALLIIIRQRILPSAKYTFDSDRVAVVKEMKELGRLETAQFTIEKIIDAKTAGGRLQQFLFGDQVLLIAHGQVIAGFDLAELKESDVKVDGTHLVLQLPAPMILVTAIDNQKTRVYDRRQGLLSKGDADLESEARQEAEIEIRKAACEAGILEQATENAQKQLSVMFSHFQFDSVTINAPAGECGE